MGNNSCCTGRRLWSDLPRRDPRRHSHNRRHIVYSAFNHTSISALPIVSPYPTFLCPRVLARMSGSYRLQTPRPRQPPAPLHFEQSSFTPSSALSSQQTPPTLLYDLPSTSSMTPPTSPKSKGRLVSPSSPSFPGRSRPGRNGRPTPPPSARNRSTTPSGVAPSELEKFAEYCRAWYV
jgi:hypothetical protein